VIRTSTFTKFEGSNSNLTVIATVSLEEKNGGPILNVFSSGDAIVTHNEWYARYKNSTMPSLCGDSAWWFLSDNYDPGESTTRDNALARFSPVLVGKHTLRTTKNMTFPEDLGVSGLPTYWNMVRETNGRNRTLCEARMLADSGMTLLHSPHEWGV
jgi:hypothetical protein